MVSADWQAAWFYREMSHARNSYRLAWGSIREGMWPEAIVDLRIADQYLEAARGWLIHMGDECPEHLTEQRAILLRATFNLWTTVILGIEDLQDELKHQRGER